MNQYQGPERHPGKQPVRVLVGNIINAFEDVYPLFREEAKEHYEKYGLRPGIPYIIAENSLPTENEALTPYANREENGDKVIVLSETFLSYVWCITYALTTNFYELMYIPSKERTHDKRNYSNLWKACHVFDYGYSLINTYSRWDKAKIINPEEFDEKDMFLIGVANNAFSKAIAYVLCHELAHVKTGHLEKDCRKKVLDQEVEAEKAAFDMIISGIKDDDDKFNTSIGVISGICCLMFFSSTMANRDHPDSDDRIRWFIDKLHLDANDALWGIPCIAYSLWDYVNKKNFDYSLKEETYKDLFYHLYKQERATW